MPGTMETSEINPMDVQVSYEDLANLEREFDDVDLDILRIQHTRTAPLFAKREALIAKIPHFWPLVIESCPPELDQWIQPSDSKLFAECLTGIRVDRFELDNPKGSPRSFSLTFTFAENDYFTDKTLTKTFWHRRSSDDITTLVSAPVPIHWKKGKDLTHGLNDVVSALWEAKQKAGGKVKDSALPEYAAVVQRIEKLESDAALSFFAWFSFVSNLRWISEEESNAANAKDKLNREKIRNGEKVEGAKEEEEEEDEDEVEIDILAEIHPDGEDVAKLLAEDLYPNALDYFAQASEQDDEDLSDMDEADLDDDSEGEEVDIRALVGKGKPKKSSASASPPPKKRKV